MPASSSENETILLRRLDLLIADVKTADLKMAVAALELAAFLLSEDFKRRKQT